MLRRTWVICLLARVKLSILLLIDARQYLIRLSGFLFLGNVLICPLITLNIHPAPKVISEQLWNFTFAANIATQWHDDYFWLVTRNSERSSSWRNIVKLCKDLNKIIFNAISNSALKYFTSLCFLVCSIHLNVLLACFLEASCIHHSLISPFDYIRNTEGQIASFKWASFKWLWWSTTRWNSWKLSRILWNLSI